ncbi:ribosomal protein S6 kinase 2 alpha [Trichonephila clavipes]|nr:ribosomal protein S6 kinase 2 alpha [Trichonephila clavipes]
MSPFVYGPDEDIKKILVRLESGKINMETEIWKRISMGAKDLVVKMLDLNPKNRYSAADVLNHEFIRSRYLLPNTRLKLKDMHAVKVDM